MIANDSLDTKNKENYFEIIIPANSADAVRIHRVC